MVTTPRAMRRSLFAALVAACLVVLAAAMVTRGGDAVRGQGPAVHPAAEITPNSPPRAGGDQLPADEVTRQTPDDGHPPAGDDAGPDSAAVVSDATPADAIGTGTDEILDITARPAAPSPISAVDGRAPPEPGDR